MLLICRVVVGTHFSTKGSETDPGTRRRCANLDHHPAELPPINEFQAKDRQSVRLLGLWSIFASWEAHGHCFFLLLFIPEDLCILWIKGPGSFAAPPSPPARSPALFLALCSICRLPPRCLPGPRDWGPGTGRGDPRPPSGTSPAPGTQPCTGLPEHTGTKTCATESRHTHTHKYIYISIWMFRSPAPAGDPAPSAVFLLTLTPSSLLKPKWFNQTDVYPT